MKNLRIYFVFLALCYTLIANAQDKPKFVKADNKKIRDMTKRVSDDGWLEFKKNVKTKHKDFFIENKDAFGLKTKDKMELKKETFEDDTKHKHYKMQQTYDGVPVEGAEFFLHYNNEDELELAHGKLYEDINISSTPKISFEKALDNAMKEFKNATFAWQDTSWENNYIRLSEYQSATYKPKSELVITFPDTEKKKGSQVILAYVMYVEVIKPKHESWRVYIKAHNGQVVRKFDAMNHCDTKNLNFTSLYNGPRVANGCRRRVSGWFSGYTNFLDFDRTWMNILTQDIDCNNIHFNSDNWGTTHQPFISTHWGLAQSWDFFFLQLAHQGYDDNNKRARALVAPNTIIDGAASYSPNDKNLRFGINTMALDIIGHEFTHGINDHTAGLGRTGNMESMSLNESFADIFGEMIERRTTGMTNLLLGNDVPWLASGYPDIFIRNLVNPRFSSPWAQPETIGDVNWNRAEGQPHTNGGV